MDLNESLVNVRRASRLLASYYRRVLDIVGMVDAALESQADHRLKWLRWDATHHRHIGLQPTSVVGRWGWDFLPIMDATFQWSTNGSKVPAGRGSTYVCLWHQTDDGYESSGRGIEPDPSTFRPAAECETYLHIMVYGVAAGACAARWLAIGGAAEASADDSHWTDGAVHVIPMDQLDEEAPGTRLQFISWRVPMTALATESDVDTHVITRLNAALDAVTQPLHA